MLSRDSVSVAIDALPWRLEVRTLAGDERNKLAHAFLHTLLRLFCNFGVLGQSCLHDPSNWGKVMNVSILIEVLAIRILGAML